MKKYTVDWSEEMVFEVLPNGAEKKLNIATPDYFADYSEAQAEIDRLKAENEALRKAQEWRTDWENLPLAKYCLIDSDSHIWLKRPNEALAIYALKEDAAKFKIIEP